MKIIYTIKDKNLNNIGKIYLKDNKFILNINNKNINLMGGMIAAFNICNKKGYEIFDMQDNLYTEKIHETYIKDFKKYGIGKYL